jgi:hypothetical protein
MGKRSCLALALALCLTVCAPSVRAADPAAAQTAPVSQGWLLPEKKAAPAYPDTGAPGVPAQRTPSPGRA